MIIRSENLVLKHGVNPLIDHVDRVRKLCNPDLNFFAVDLAGTGVAIMEPTSPGAGTLDFDYAGGRNVLISGFSGEIIKIIAAQTTTQVKVIEDLKPSERKKPHISQQTPPAGVAAPDSEE